MSGLDYGGYLLLGPAYYFIDTATEDTGASSATAEEQAANPDYCDRNTALGRIGICEAREWFDSFGNVLSSPVVTFAGFTLLIGTGGLVTVALLNSTGAAPVLQQSGAAFAQGIRKGAKAAFGGR